MRCLLEYIAEKKLKPLQDTDDADIPELLENFYVNARTNKGELYHVQTLKGLRSNLNRWFKEKRDLDIVNDVRFNKANNMFKGAKVHAKKAGKGITKSTETISDEDLQQLATYFYIDHMVTPNQRILQRNVLFNMIYYLCRRGQENLYEMRKDWFEVKVDSSTGDKTVVQVHHELDKNHREDYTSVANEGKMYDVAGESKIIEKDM